jgi:hypothetical protein
MPRRRKEMLVTNHGERVKSYWEVAIANLLAEMYIPYKYESRTFPFTQTGAIRNTFCATCGSKDLHTGRKYTPDFELLGYADLFIEGKGRFLADHRKILKGMQASHPRVKIVMAFQRDDTFGKQTYSSWCAGRGIPAPCGIGELRYWLERNA